MLHKIPGLIFVIGIMGIVSGCDQKPKVMSSSTGLMPQRTYDVQQLALGQQVYVANCAVCHGDNAQGASNWQQRNPDGTFPPPPLNGTGHSWHHSTEILYDVIANGSQPGQGNMPAWKDRLTKEQIDAVIIWFQSLWPDQVYAAWYEMQQRK
ncbi:MAG: cytochrome c [Gammaproteobacteria bacterium]|nr:cytochrome c [Gammaproteobacteria bacterium]